MEGKLFQLIDERGIVVCNKCKLANSFEDRLLGLMFKTDLVDFDGLLIKPCNSIHTFFMRFNLDILFLDKKMRVVKIVRDIRPWRVTWIYFKSHQVLELKSGTLSEKITEGCILREHV